MVRLKIKEHWNMRFFAIGFFLAIITGCGDCGNYHRGYVISQSQLDDLIDESESTTQMQPVP